MKIAISSTGTTKESQIDQRFGRCKYFALYDTETKEFTTISNDAQMASGGAGVQSAQTIAKNNASVVLTGNVGPNAFQALSAADITIITGISGTVADTIDKYEQGDYSTTEGPTTQSHSGMSS